MLSILRSIFVVVLCLSIFLKHKSLERSDDYRLRMIIGLESPVSKALAWLKAQNDYGL